MKSLTCHLIPLFALAVALAACRAEEPVAAPETPPAKANPDLFYIPGRVSVQFDDATTRMVEEALAQGQPTKVSALDGLLEDLGIKSLRRVFPDAGEWEPRTRKAGLCPALCRLPRSSRYIPAPSTTLIFPASGISTIPATKTWTLTYSPSGSSLPWAATK